MLKKLPSHLDSLSLVVRVSRITLINKIMKKRNFNPFLLSLVLVSSLSLGSCSQEDSLTEELTAIQTRSSDSSAVDFKANLMGTWVSQNGSLGHHPEGFHVLAFGEHPFFGFSLGTSSHQIEKETPIYKLVDNVSNIHSITSYDNNRVVTGFYNLDIQMSSDGYRFVLPLKDGKSVEYIKMPEGNFTTPLSSYNTIDLVGTWVSERKQDGGHHVYNFTENGQLGTNAVKEAYDYDLIDPSTYHFHDVLYNNTTKKLEYKDKVQFSLEIAFSKDGESMLVGYEKYTKEYSPYARHLTATVKPHDLQGIWASEAKYEGNSIQLYKFTEDHKLGIYSISSPINLDLSFDEICNYPYDLSKITYLEGDGVKSATGNIKAPLFHDNKMSFITQEGTMIVKYTKLQSAEMRNAMTGTWIADPTGVPGAYRDIIQFTETSKMRISQIAEDTSVNINSLKYSRLTSVNYNTDNILVLEENEHIKGGEILQVTKVGGFGPSKYIFNIGGKSTVYTKIK